MSDHGVRPRVVLVSGGARGLGLALVGSLLHNGGALVATFSRHRSAEIAALAEAFADRLSFVEADANDEAQMELFVNSTSERWGAIDGLVNNAAIGQDHLIANIPPNLLRAIVETNLLAPILLTRLVVRKMLLEGRGAIVNISSICGARGFTGLSAYSAAKGGLDAFTRSLARELGPRRIRVNAVAPGFFASEMSAILPADQLAAIRRRTPLGELIEARSIVPVIERLLFDDEMTTGQVLCIDGGATC